MWDAVGLELRLGASSVTLGGLLKHLAWVEELYFQHRLGDRQFRAPFDQLDLESDWEDWAWSSTADDTPMRYARYGSTPCTALAKPWPSRSPAVAWSRRPQAG